MPGLNTASEPDKIRGELINIRRNNICSPDLKYYPHSNGRILFYVCFIFCVQAGSYMFANIRK